MRTLRFVLCLLASGLSARAAKTLDIYFIDVEGGKSVLFVAPSGQSMLFDAGWPGNNNIPWSGERIIEVAHAANIAKIDLLVISHFDVDHMGDVPRLASQLPIAHLFDHGDVQAPAAAMERVRQRFAPYALFREKIPHTTVHSGDKIPLKGVDVQVVSAAGQLISKPLRNAGKPNPLCATAKQADALPSDVEDDQSIGLAISYGPFRMLDLADLEAHLTHDLVCPNNLLGNFDVYNVNVHGQFKGIAPELIGAIHAPVLIQANGARKGADAQSWPILAKAPGLVDLWQLHYSQNAGPGANPPQNFIANPDGPDAFHWIKLSVAQDGSFTVTNTRNGFSKRYAKHGGG